MLICFTFSQAGSDAFILKAYASFCAIKGQKPLPVEVKRENGKPFLADAEGERTLFASLSHSGEITACALSEQPVGIDIQKRKKIDFAAVSARFFSKKTEDEKEFYRLFCAAEARYKADGGSFFAAMKKGTEGVRIYDLFSEYTFAVKGEEEVLLSECHE